MHIDNGSHYRTTLRNAGACLLALSIVFVTACSSSTSNGDSLPKVIVTTGILGDVVQHIAGDNIDLVVLTPPGVDPHDFAPSAQQVAAISSADLVVANGLGLEGGLIDLLEQARSEGIPVFEVGPELDPRRIESGGFDPHFWQDPERMVTATALLASALINDAGLDSEITSTAAAKYGLEIEGAHIEAGKLLSAVPENRRVMVTNHDAFEYFAERYGYTIIGTIIPGGSTLGQPSSAQLAHLVELIVQTEIPAIFVENISSPNLAETLASETGRSIAVVELVSDALGEPGSETDSYVKLIIYNARTISSALNTDNLATET